MGTRPSHLAVTGPVYGRVSLRCNHGDKMTLRGWYYGCRGTRGSGRGFGHSSWWTQSERLCCLAEVGRLRSRIDDDAWRKLAEEEAMARAVCALLLFRGLQDPVHVCGVRG